MASRHAEGRPLQDAGQGLEPSLGWDSDEVVSQVMASQVQFYCC